MGSHVWRLVAWAGALLILGSTACSEVAPETGPLVASPDGGGVRAPLGLETAIAVARADRVLDRFFTESLNGLQPAGEAFVSPGHRGVGASTARVAARVGHRAELAFEVGPSPSARHAIRFWREGAAGREAELIDGRLFYADAHPSTHLVVAATAQRFEELFVLESDAAPTRFSWRIELPAGISNVAEQPDGAVLFLDDAGMPALRIHRPFALDARGKRRDARLSVVGDRLVVELDRTGLEYPIVLDPAYENAEWTLLNGTSPPPGRYGHAMAHHAATGVTLVTGGTDVVGGVAYLADAWTLSGSTWSVASSPSGGRRYHAMAHDAARGETVLFGGYNGSPIDETWIYASGSWTQKCAGSCTAGVDKPSARYGHAMAYDSALQRVLLFGGNPGSGYNSEIWEWNGTTAKWSKRCGSGCTAPTARTMHGMAYDAQNARTVIYGGTASGGMADITVLYNSSTDKFEPATTPAGLGQRTGSGMGYDSVRKKVLLFGGKPGASPSKELWQWDGSAWAEIQQAGSAAAPTARSSTPLVFEPANKRFVMYSGDTVSPDPADPKDTWAMIVRGDACSNGTTCDTGNCVDGVCCLTPSCGVCQRCDLGQAGTFYSVGKCTSVVSADDTDTCTGANTCSASGACKKKNGQTCTLATDCASNNCVDGYCCADACATPCRSCANTAGTCTTLVTNQDDGAQCQGTSTCSAGADCKKKNGQTCTLATDCASNNCVDGYCCADACTTPCRSCANTAGTCTTLITSGKDGTACGGVNSCDSAGNCKKDDGQGCSANGDCLNGHCVDSYCCDSTCGNGCDVCSAALGATQNGKCTVLGTGSAGQCGAYLCGGAASCPQSCGSDANCSPGNYCKGGSCIPKEPLGQPCASASVCASNLCADGVCCDGTCTGKCMACAAGNKEDGSLANNGKCGAAKKGANPGNQCVTGSDPCGDQASCSGTPGECAKGAAGTSCGPTTCVNGSVSGKVCNGAGLCTDQNNANCSPYVCKGSACASPCTADSDCVTDNYCSNGVCIPKIDNGKTCTVANACKSSFCVDQVCCDAPCNGQCEACAETGSLGQCKPVAGKPRGTRTDCSGTTGDKCKGACDGANKSACAYPAAGTACKDASCSGDVSQPAGTCDGAGLCSLLPTQNCLPYACKAATGVCASTCASDTDCAQGAKCDTNTGKCAVTSATCKDATTVLQPNGQSESCVPYKCVGGACQQQCASGSDCAPGYTCQGNACVSADGGIDSGVGGSSGAGGSGAAGGSSGGASAGGTSSGGGAGKKADGGGDDGGCGCRVPAKSDPTHAGWLLAVAFAALRRRRAA
ncbi:MAG: hypothetical protein IT377_31635 [Polyangiaceae bacterium]|nr:hypothetical protein [Myxococcales bacterium]MCC6903563.1 hypothetical protein [Polyangiaceae bacterium]